MVLPGVCREAAIESQRNGSAEAPITITAQTPGTVKIVREAGVWKLGEESWKN